jgi:hypothetical protein
MDADELRTLMMCHIQTTIAGAVLAGTLPSDRAIAALDMTPANFAALLALVRDSGADFCLALEQAGGGYAVALATAAYMTAAARQDEIRRSN